MRFSGGGGGQRRRSCMATQNQKTTASPQLLADILQVLESSPVHHPATVQPTPAALVRLHIRCSSFVSACLKLCVDSAAALGLHCIRRTSFAHWDDIMDHAMTSGCMESTPVRCACYIPHSCRAFC